MPAKKNFLRGSDWAERLAERLASAPAATTTWMEHHTRLLKSDTYSRVGLLQLQRQLCYLKLYLAKSPLHQLGYQLGYGRGLRAFDRANELARRGLRVPRALACLLVPEGMLLLTEGIAGGRDLRVLWQGQPAAEQAALLLNGAGATLAALHSAGYAHGDCKWSNLLWCDGSIYLVDLEAVREVTNDRAGQLPLHPRQLRDLARYTIDAEELGVGTADFELFLSSYCAHLGCDRAMLVDTMQAALETIRRRHRAKYGNTGEPLL